MKSACKSLSWKGRIVHVVTGLVEMIPLLGGVASLFEKCIASNKSNSFYKESQEKTYLKYAIDPSNQLHRFSQTNTSTFGNSETPTQVHPETPSENQTNKLTVQSNTHHQLDQQNIPEDSQLLKNDCFAWQPNDDQHELGNTQGISEVQGTAKFRKEVVVQSAQDTSIFTPKYVRGLQKANPLISRLLQFKRLGHAFAISGDLTLKKDTASNQLVQLEGFHETIVRPMLSNTFAEFAQKNRNLVNEVTEEWIQKTLTNALYCDNATDENIRNAYEKIKIMNEDSDEAPVLIGTGYDWHSTQIIFWKNFFIFCNRGNGSECSPGIRVFSIHDKDKITEDFIRKLALRMDVNRNTYQDITQIKKTLAAQEVYYHEMKTQKVGNCTYVSLKSAIFALLALKIRTPTSSFCNAFTTQKPIYKAFTAFDREKLLEDLLIDVEEYNKPSPGPLPYNTVLDTVIKKVNFKVRNSKKLRKTLIDRFPPDLCSPALTA